MESLIRRTTRSSRSVSSKYIISTKLGVPVNVRATSGAIGNQVLESTLPTLVNQYEHETVRHSVSEYVRGDVSTNGKESFWSMLKRSHTETFHKMSPKRLSRYIGEFVGRHNIREADTLAQMQLVYAGRQ